MIRFMADWQKEMVDNIGREVRKHRGDRSLLWLEKRTSELGHKVARSGISQLENGNRKSISIAELLVLSAALEVPLTFLIWPLYPGGMSEILPGHYVSASEAHDVTVGRRIFDEYTDEDGVHKTILPIPHVLVQLNDELEKMANIAELFPNVILDDATRNEVSESLTAHQARRVELEAGIIQQGGYLMTEDEMQELIEDTEAYMSRLRKPSPISDALRQMGGGSN